MKKKPLTDEQIEELKKLVVAHFRRFDTKNITKQETKELSGLYALELYKKLTTGQPHIFARDAASPVDINHSKLLEESSDKTGEEMLRDVLMVATYRIEQWHIATRLASMYITRDEVMPPSLATFSVCVLNGEFKEPTTGHSKTQNRDLAISSCVYWIVTDDPYGGFRERLNIEQPITAYVGGNADRSQTACEIVRSALDEHLSLKPKVTYDSVVKIWKTHKGD